METIGRTRRFACKIWAAASQLRMPSPRDPWAAKLGFRAQGLGFGQLVCVAYRSFLTASFHPSTALSEQRVLDGLGLRVQGAHDVACTCHTQFRI